MSTDAPNPWFTRLSRSEQRRNLLRRLRTIRSDLEQQQRDLEHFNALQRKRGGEELPRDPEVAAMLAWCDQRIAELKER